MYKLHLNISRSTSWTMKKCDLWSRKYSLCLFISVLSCVFVRFLTRNSAVSCCFRSISCFISFSSQHRALVRRSLEPPEMIPDFENSVPSNDTVYMKHIWNEINRKILHLSQRVNYCVNDKPWRCCWDLILTRLTWQPWKSFSGWGPCLPWGAPARQRPHSVPL